MQLLSKFNHWLARALFGVAGLVLVLQVILMSAKAAVGIASSPHPPAWYAWVQSWFSIPRVKSPPTWMSKFSELGILWVGFLGAALGVRRGAHMGVEALTAVLPRCLRRVLESMVWLLIAAFSVTFTWQAVAYVAQTRQMNQTIPGTMPLVWDGAFLGVFDVNDGVLAGMFGAGGSMMVWPMYLSLVLAGAASALFAFEHYVRTALEDGSSQAPAEDGGASPVADAPGSSPETRVQLEDRGAFPVADALGSSPEPRVQMEDGGASPVADAWGSSPEPRLQTENGGAGKGAPR